MHKTDHTKKRLLHVLESIIAGIGALIGLSFIGVIAQSAHTMMLIAPFGATAVLLFSAPNSPFSNPMNIFGGYFISMVVGARVLTYTNTQWLPIAIGLSLVIILMHGFRVILPILWPVIIGLVILVIVSMGVQRLKQKLLTKES